jgi:hypothetical protein
MRLSKALGLVALMAGSLSACNDGSSGAAVSTSTAPGTLIYNPPIRVASLDAGGLTAQLSSSTAGQQLLALAGTPKCGVDFHYFQYRTLGAKAEQTTASGAIMAPTGGSGCSGALPILVYTHGTAATKSYNIANILDQTNEAWQESALMAAMFAAQGYIVVASNYAGYDSSTLPYHPYLNGAQQSQDVINALTAARTALGSGLPSADTDNGKLFITGYSQGGYVAMATHKAMQAAGLHVTASSPMSGPYALAAFGDAVVFGQISLGSTVNFPLIINSYQQAYGNVYQAPSDFYSATYSNGIATLFPSSVPVATLFQENLLPELSLFDSTTPVTGDSALDAALAVPSNALLALGFGNPYLINNSVRVAAAEDALANPDGAFPTPIAGVPTATNPQYGLRIDLKTNDLRNWTPDGSAPMLLCGGHDDPEVWYSLDTAVMAAYWPNLISTTGSPNVVTILDVDPGQALLPNGGIAAQIGTIAATVFGFDLLSGVTSPATIAQNVQTAIVVGSAESGASPFAAYFTNGVPNSPQGILVAGMASVAAQAVTTEFAAGVLSPTLMGTDVGFAIDEYYHYPLVQSACEVAARSFFAQF